MNNVLIDVFEELVVFIARHFSNSLGTVTSITQFLVQLKLPKVNFFGFLLGASMLEHKLLYDMVLGSLSQVPITLATHLREQFLMHLLMSHWCLSWWCLLFQFLKTCILFKIFDSNFNWFYSAFLYLLHSILLQSFYKLAFHEFNILNYVVFKAFLLIYHCILLCFQFI